MSALHLPDPALTHIEIAQPHAAQILHQLERLQYVGRVLYIAAHPDDENTRLLAFLAGQRKLRVGYLSLTRGDGGQNLIGSEQGPLLGMIRTHELLQARRLDGAEQFFTRAKDFGYSKSSEESLRIWGHQAVLSDVVWVIRRFQPDLIITRFPEKGDTHGHHLASAILAREAFHAAADPQRFPEQLPHAPPWQTKRLLHNISTWMLRRLKRKINLSRYHKLDIGPYNPLLGHSYGEIAAHSRSMHKSQGFGFPTQRGPAREYFQYLAGEKAQSDILDGLDTSWKRLPHTDAIAKHLQAAKDAFLPHQPYRSVPALLAAYQALQQHPHIGHDLVLRERAQAIHTTLAACLGLYLDAQTNAPSAPPATTLQLTLHALNRSPLPLTLLRVDFSNGTHIDLQRVLPEHKPFLRRLALTVPKDAPISAVNWLATTNDSSGLYPLKDLHTREQPTDNAPLYARFTLQIAQHTLSFSRILRHLRTDPVRGEVARRTEIAPPLTLTPQSPFLMFPNHQPRALTLTVRAHTANANGTLSLQLPLGWTATPAKIALSIPQTGSLQTHTFQITPPNTPNAHSTAPSASTNTQNAHSTAPSASTNTQNAHSTAPSASTNTQNAHSTVLFAVPVLHAQGRTYTWAETQLNYAHIPAMTILQPASIRLVPLKLHIPQGSFAYIQGSGDRIPEALQQIGLPIQILTDKEIITTDLSRFRSILVGIRAFNANTTLQLHKQRLWDYVAQGGTLIVQYTVSQWWRPLKLSIAPFPLTVGRQRVTQEDAPVTLLQPQHPIFQKPHAIEQNDFQGWIQERGLYFASAWPSTAYPLLRMADPNEAAQEGSLVLGHYGKGAYLYTGLSFFRQLPAGVPGAYRLLLNLLAYTQTSTPQPTKTP